MANFTFTEKGWKDYIHWQMQDRKTLKKINSLMEDINRNGPLHGVGKPELLKHSKSGLYSRRIDETNRLVYEISGNQIIIMSCKGHYND